VFGSKIRLAPIHPLCSPFTGPTISFARLRVIGPVGMFGKVDDVGMGTSPLPLCVEKKEINQANYVKIHKALFRS
jgi:hypothetical protein